MSVMLIRVQSPLLRTLKHKGRYVCWSMVTVIFDGSCFLSLGNKVIFHTFLLRSVPDSLDNLKPCLYMVAKDIGEETCISSGVGVTRLTSLFPGISVHCSCPLNHTEMASVFIIYFSPFTSKVPSKEFIGVVPSKEVVVNLALNPLLLLIAIDVLSSISLADSFSCADA